ncbi:hypothetical protein [Psychrobacillus sp. FSL H8-0487]|uniref:hypothetical protein n=1 Tax=Psychrobacillus sp. FSL H8-0487 TaxID=2921391 RepID=UPI0030F6112B
MPVTEKNIQTEDKLKRIQNLIIHNSYMLPQAKSSAALILFKKQNEMEITEDEELYFDEIINFLSFPQ